MLSVPADARASRFVDEFTFTLRIGRERGHRRPLNHIRPM